ncbi:Mitofusin-2 [Thelohanellus kitauei]|uniref:Mitofusin-2 n=1 Tax=Thelohanellus kitauei TaxID=669202 RepID=A0A0C2N906_THEKT|nr:Mitofusin-2 [Thelohanellus kitauei]
MPPVYYGSKRNFSESAINNHEETPNIPHLAKFLVAKKIVNNIFQDTETLLKDEYDFYKNNPVDSTVEFKIFEQLEEITTSINRIIVIRQILTRDTMKVAFFGRTSNGKSSVINAILGDSILPSGIGHTTSCFLSMKGCSEPEPFVIAPESPEKLAISVNCRIM